jgi:hypothetical protein
MSALSGLTSAYDGCAANVDECITNCENFKSSACFRCRDPSINVKTFYIAKD